MMFSVALLCMLVIFSAQAYKPGDVSSFFLKAPKSVPRAGRAAPEVYDDLFSKSTKPFPRVGRRDRTLLSNSPNSYWHQADDFSGIRTQPEQYEYWQNSADSQNENAYLSDVNAEVAKNFYNYLLELSMQTENQDEPHNQHRNHFIQEKNGYSDLNKELEDVKYQRPV